MANETGEMKLLDNFRNRTDIVLAAVNYKPTNLLLTVANLEAQYVAAIPVQLAPNEVAVYNCQTVYDAVFNLVRRSRRLLKSFVQTVRRALL